MTYDIVISSIPFFAYTAPAAAPALLKGHLQSQGFSCLAIDLNVESRKSFQPEILSDLIGYWTALGNQILTEQTKNDYSEYLDNCAKRFCNYDTSWLGFSVFSIHSQAFLADLLPYIKKHNSKGIKIVIGGHGLDAVYTDSISQYIDHSISGEGDLSLVELLKGNIDYPGIDSPGVQINDLNQIGFADYTDYNLNEGYDTWYDSPMIQITGSRGCVKDCSFCNVKHYWEKYKYRSGAHIAQEIIQNYETTGVKHFYFTDSLINGNLKELVNMMQILTEYKNNTSAPITWGGQWIVRSQRGLPKNYYPLIKSSGGHNITMGVESGSESVRKHMKKYFSNKDLDDEIEQFSKHGIKVGFFIIIGYPTETEEDFKDTLRMIKRYAKYVADGTIIGIALGRGYVPQSNTDLFQSSEIQFYDNKTKQKWYSKTANSNYLQNMRRRLIAQKVLENFYWPSTDLEYEFRILVNNAGSLFDEQSKQLKDMLLEDSSLELDPEFQTNNNLNNLQIQITVDGSQGINYPQMTIEINDEINHTVEVVGEKTFEYTVVNAQQHNIIKLTLINKTGNETVVENGNIVKDMTIKLREFKINGIRISELQLQSKGTVITDTGSHQSDGLYMPNSYYKFEFENPVLPYFGKQHSRYFDTQIESRAILNKFITLYNHFIEST